MCHPGYSWKPVECDSRKGIRGGRKWDTCSPGHTHLPSQHFIAPGAKDSQTRDQEPVINHGRLDYFVLIFIFITDLFFK